MITQKVKRTYMQIIFYAILILILAVAMLIAYFVQSHWYSYTAMILGGILMALLKQRHLLTSFRGIAIWLAFLLMLPVILVVGRENKTVSVIGNVNSALFRAINYISADISGESVFRSKLGQHAEHISAEGWIPPEAYHLLKIELSQCCGYLLIPKEAPNTGIFYQLHGGGYVLGFDNSYHETALRYSACNQNSAVFSLDYRTAPDSTYPSALEDAVEGYQWLLAQGYNADEIIVCGDSAGGGLALSLALYLRDNFLSLPKMLILSSPWTDLAQSGSSYRNNMTTDPMFGAKSMEKAKNPPIPTLYAGGMNLTDPYLSPAYGDYRGMPPMLIQVGLDELLLSDSEIVAQKAKEAEVDVQLLSYSGMYHTFYIISPDLPESKTAWKAIEEFIQKRQA